MRWNLVGINQPVGVHGNTLKNLRMGLVERVFRVEGPGGVLVAPPQAIPHAFDRKLEWFTSSYDSVVRMCRPLSRDQFLATYSGRRRTLYSIAADEYEKRGIREKDARVRAFIKIEALVKLSGDFRTLKDKIVPRVIQPRNPRLPVYGYALGRFIKIYEHLMKDAVARVGRDVSGHGGPVIFKGLDPNKRAEVLRHAWEQRSDPVAVTMDASRFDQHTGQDALSWEHKRWVRSAPAQLRNELACLLRMQLRNKCVASCRDGTARYTTRGCRMSGDMNTSGGNCLIMSGMLLSYVREKGIQGSVCNDGDDSVVIIERRDLDWFRTGLSDWFLELGYRMEVEDAVDVFERIDFCQCSPVFVNGGWRMVRNPHKSCAKDLTHVTNFPCNDYSKWLPAVGQCGMALTDGIPVLQAFYACFEPWEVARLPDELTSRGFYHMSKGMKWRGIPISDDSRISFYKAFGVTPDDQLLLEAQWKEIKLTHLPSIEPRHPNHLPRWSSPLHPRW